MFHREESFVCINVVQTPAQLWRNFLLLVHFMPLREWKSCCLLSSNKVALFYLVLLYAYLQKEGGCVQCFHGYWTWFCCKMSSYCSWFIWLRSCNSWRANEQVFTYRVFDICSIIRKVDIPKIESSSNWLYFRRVICTHWNHEILLHQMKIFMVVYQSTVDIKNVRLKVS